VSTPAFVFNALPLEDHWCYAAFCSPDQQKGFRSPAMLLSCLQHPTLPHLSTQLSIVLMWPRFPLRDYPTPNGSSVHVPGVRCSLFRRPTKILSVRHQMLREAHVTWQQTLLEKQAKARGQRVLRRWRTLFQGVMLGAQLLEEYGDHD